jgi:hypothetical protein
MIGRQGARGYEGERSRERETTGMKHFQSKFFVLVAADQWAP